MISFVVPVYKKSVEIFNKAVTSLVEMSEKDIEIIAVFDGADPVLEAEADRWKETEPRFRHIVIDHGGACKARNEGAKLAKGDYISFWDADCYAEPEMAMMWLRTFRDNPDCDFVYSGYKFMDPNLSGFDSEPFDPWTLSKYNYIASMFPVKREKAVLWDEELDGLQDWDFWRRIVENGSKGKFIPGYGFWTEVPDTNSISGQAVLRVERIRKVREKHGDKKSPLLIFGQTFRHDAQRLAQVLEADFFNGPFWIAEEYDAVISMGLHPWDIENAAGVMRGQAKAKKILYWTGHDANSIAMTPFIQAKALIETVKKEIDVNLSVDEEVTSLLENMGIDGAKTVIFPHAGRQLNTPFPEKFKVLAFADETYTPHLKAVRSAVPDVDFDFVTPETPYDVRDYTLLIQFTKSPFLITGNRNGLMLGRYLISNVQRPYAGFIEIGEDVTKFKNEVIDEIRRIQELKGVNHEAMEYYLNEADPETFRSKIKSMIAEEK